MSLFHPEECRQCKRCGWAWNAARYTSPPHPVILETSIARTGVLHENRAVGYAIWSRCPRCQAKGRKIKTIKRAYALDGKVVPS